MTKRANERSVLSRLIASLPLVATTIVISLVADSTCHHSLPLSPVPAALADELPQELIPPDVTLSNTSTTPIHSAPDASTPGIGSGSSASVPPAGSRLPATGIQGKQPQPPPQGSSAKFSGFNSPPPTPPGHKGMPPPYPGAQQQQQPPAQGSVTPQGPDPIAVV